MFERATTKKHARKNMVASSRCPRRQRRKERNDERGISTKADPA
jgi:hypothetical protein